MVAPPALVTPMPLTITRFAQDGTPVIVVDVEPFVIVVGVPVTILLLTPLTARVPVPAGTVIVPLAVAAACTVVVPELEPVSTRLVVQVSVGCVMPVDPAMVTVMAAPFLQGQAVEVVLQGQVATECCLALTNQDSFDNLNFEGLGVSKLRHHAG